MNPTVVTVTLNPALDKTVTVPSFEVGGLNRVQQVRLDPGGKGINVAKVLRGFDVEVTAAGLIAGTIGRHLLKQLDAQRVDHRFVEVAGETRTNLKVYDESARVTTELNELGFDVQAEDLEAFRQQVEELLSEASYLVLGGSLPQGVPDEIYGTLIELANAKGVRTILDADGMAFKKGLEARPYAVKPNLFELQQLTGRPLDAMADIVAAGQELLERGISLVVISMGGDGAVFITKEQVVHTTPFAITPQSTVGAGDSMVAAIVHGLAMNKPLAELAQWATTAGTVTASKRGTQVCTLAEVSEQVHRVQTTRI
ncbi:1-phosphofructokinase [Tumebacillus permanentifrigoris]|uniref:Tagatose-6-phosphate kinase n=1 Tax=Tumebacillus permanentifrigoris TaxID=378543 RepID=A0A316DR56_9BACL|nr:1-phosphofructokinase [Tumebacillus permanentifrigoris]PWK06655.1 fructose-1-phosphate kinase [Tumebacillus permanentifrigoris]